MESYAVVMGPKLFIVSPGVPAGWILHVKLYGIGNDEGGFRLSFVFDAVMERSGKRQTSQLSTSPRKYTFPRTRILSRVKKKIGYLFAEMSHPLLGQRCDRGEEIIERSPL
ncbi:hypothetical protein OUZ56_021811 [Daphnia magna]|uniref:Uncharacterized protein n=1 Tax=Daphnia magna TaxID=35525 RepID=A0ABR0AUK8_9CRUS|nr:hypothetical protein OUZ56_021811 [Daphnia magna]